MNDRVKVFFELEPDEDGYPPCSCESLWAEKVGENSFKIDNIPFYARDVSLGDVVYAPPSSDGSVYKKHMERSENSTIRVILFDGQDTSPLFDMLKKCGCEYEGGVPKDLIAVNIPPSADLNALLRYLNSEHRAGRLEYEEAAKRY